MIKKYFMLSSLLGWYASIDVDELSSESGELYILFLSFKTYNPVTWVEEDEDDSNCVVIYLCFSGDTEEERLENVRNGLRLSRQNYDYIIQKWQQVVKQKPKYFILSRDDNGWVDLEMKNELSSDDQKYLDQDKIKKLQDMVMDK